MHSVLENHQCTHMYSIYMYMYIHHYSYVSVSPVAKRFVREYGCLRLSVGEAMRRVMAQFPGSKLAELMQVHLRAGQPVPDELCVHALERALLDVQCNTRGYVICIGRHLPGFCVCTHPALLLLCCAGLSITVKPA